MITHNHTYTYTQLKTRLLLQEVRAVPMSGSGREDGPLLWGQQRDRTRQAAVESVFIPVSFLPAYWPLTLASALSGHLLQEASYFRYLRHDDLISIKN